MKVKEQKKINQRKAQKYGRMMSYNPTKSEKIMMEILDYYHIKYQFQKQFFDDNHCYILDFLIIDLHGRLVIEIDGPSHNHSKEYDKKRTEWLISKRHCRVIRFTNDQVTNHSNEVASKILELGLKDKPEPKKSKVRKLITVAEWNRRQGMIELEKQVNRYE